MAGTPTGFTEELHMGVLHWFKLRRFEGEGSAGSPDPPGGGDPTGGTGAGDPAGGDPDPASGDPKDQFKPIASQEDLDRIITARLKRQRDQFKDYDDLKAKADEFDKMAESQKSELQKAQDAAAKAEADRDQALVLANKRLIRGEAKAAAAGLGFIDPDDAYALMDRTDIKVDDDGNVAGLEEALKTLVASKPHLVGSKRLQGSGDGGAGGGGNGNGGKPNYRESDDDEFADALRKHGLRPRG